MIVLVVLLVLSLGYLHFYGFPGFLKDALIGELRKAGYAAQFGSIRLDLFRGFVASEATFADARAPDQPLAQIDELELRFNLRRLIHKQNPIRAIHIANAVVAVPTPPDENGPAKFTASDAYATFEFERRRLGPGGQTHGCLLRHSVERIGLCPARRAPSTPRRPTAPQPPVNRGQFLFLTKAVRELNRIQVTEPPATAFGFQSRFESAAGEPGYGKVSRQPPSIS